MRCTPEVVATVLDIFAGAIPGEHPAINEATVDVWTGTLQPYDALTVLAVAREVSRTVDRFPSLNVFLKAVQGRARRDADALPAGPAEEPRPEVAKTVFRMLRDYAASVPEHNHRRGEDRCPACSTSEKRADAFREEAEELFKVLRRGGAFVQGS